MHDRNFVENYGNEMIDYHENIFKRIGVILFNPFTLFQLYILLLFYLAFKGTGFILGGLVVSIIIAVVYIFKIREPESMYIEKEQDFISSELTDTEPIVEGIICSKCEFENPAVFSVCFNCEQKLDK